MRESDSRLRAPHFALTSRLRLRRDKRERGQAAAVPPFDEPAGDRFIQCLRRLVDRQPEGEEHLVPVELVDRDPSVEDSQLYRYQLLVRLDVEPYRPENRLRFSRAGERVTAAEGPSLHAPLAMNGLEHG
jgi:hypothetical protein